MRRTSRGRYFFGALTVLGLIFLGTGRTLAQEADPLAWPRRVEAKNVVLTIYEPQMEFFQGDSLHARAAISAQRPSDKDPIFGALWFGARVMVNRDERTVTLSTLTVTGLRFPGATDAQLKTVAGIIEKDAPSWDLTISLDALLASAELHEQKQETSQAYRIDPPKILVVEKPAVLVLIDGDPLLQKVEGSTLLRVVNTAAFLVLDPNRKKYYLSGTSAWFSAPAVEGPWTYEPRPADAAVRLAQKETDQPEEVRPDPTISPDSLPTIVVSTEPAELISLRGAPTYTPLANTDLLYASNTESDLFLEIPSQRYYVLLAGRWYHTADLREGPWIPDDPSTLPESFARISPESPKGYVLASVAGTQEAREAVMDAQVPQTAVVERASATASVTYDGEPTFEPIEQTEMRYAVNTSSAVILAGGRYYLCDSGVWFVGVAPSGPWTVAASLPQEIYTIPPSCPVYYVRYVYIYDSTPDVVYVGYTPGYTGSYVYGPTVIYGTGYHYVPWYGSVYYPRPVTYGFSVHYNPWTGWTMGYHAGWGTPYGGFHLSFYSGYHPWYGPPVYRPPYAYRGPTHYTTNRSVTVNNNIYVDRRNGVRSTGTTRGEPQTRPSRPATPSTGSRPSPRPQTREPNNVVTDRQGNVYRKTDQGWQQRENKQWAPTDRSASPSTRPSQQTPPQTRQLDRDMQARQRSADRTQQYRQQQSRPQTSTPQRSSGKKR
jgi:hypothetical protein